MRKTMLLTAMLLTLALLAGCGTTKGKQYNFVFYGAPIYEFDIPGNNFNIKKPQLKSLTNMIKDKDTAKAIELANKLFRINARLPEGFDKQLAAFQDKTQTGTFKFPAVNGYSVNLTVDKKRLVSDFRIGVKFPKMDIKIKQKLLTEEEAFQLYKNYLDFSFKTKPGKQISGSPAGVTYKKRIMIIRVFTPPYNEYFFVMDNITGQILPRTPASCAKACSWLYPKAEDFEQRKEIMALIVAFNEYCSQPCFFSKPADIPGYEKSKLDSDIEKEIYPPFTVINKQGNNVTYGAYTYQQLGGIVNRYQFVFKDGVIETADCVMLTHGIGAAEYIE